MKKDRSDEEKEQGNYYEEKFGKRLLEQCYSGRSSSLEKTEHPDWSSDEVGLEVTSAVNPDTSEIESNFLNNKASRKDKNKIKVYADVDEFVDKVMPNKDDGFCCYSSCELYPALINGSLMTREENDTDTLIKNIVRSFLGKVKKMNNGESYLIRKYNYLFINTNLRRGRMREMKRGGKMKCLRLLRPLSKNIARMDIVQTLILCLCV